MNNQNSVDDLPRFFVDIRAGCGAVRDSKHRKYDPYYQGLHREKKSEKNTKGLN